MINEELLQSLRVISPEEQTLLAGSTGIQRGIYMDANSDIIDAKKLLDSGRLITLRPHTRFAHFPEHSHNYVEVVYMCSGSTTHLANGKEIHLHEGELLFFGQGARQEILPAGDQDIAVNFIILPQFFDKVLDDVSRRQVEAYLMYKWFGYLPDGSAHGSASDVTVAGAADLSDVDFIAGTPTNGAGEIGTALVRAVTCPTNCTFRAFAAVPIGELSCSDCSLDLAD